MLLDRAGWLLDGGIRGDEEERGSRSAQVVQTYGARASPRASAGASSTLKL